MWRERFGLRACWSTPIFSPQRKVLGSFAMYYTEPRAPRDDELRLIETAADIARIAIEQQRAYSGAAAQRGARPGDPAGDPGLDVPDHGRRRVPRLPRQGRLETARPAVGLPQQEHQGRAAAASRRGARAGRSRGRSPRTKPRRSNTRWAPKARAILRGVHRPLRRRQDSQHRPGHHRAGSARNWKPTRNGGSWRT